MLLLACDLHKWPAWRLKLKFSNILCTTRAHGCPVINYKYPFSNVILCGQIFLACICFVCSAIFLLLQRGGDGGGNARWWRFMICEFSLQLNFNNEAHHHHRHHSLPGRRHCTYCMRNNKMYATKLTFYNVRGQFNAR